MCQTRQKRLARTAIVLLAISSGCREKEPDFEVITLEGKVQKIDAKPDGTGSITVTYYSDSQGQEVVGTGMVTRETEIMINGVISRLNDIREGERVRGQVRVNKKSRENEQIALKIHVDRVTSSGPEGE